MENEFFGAGSIQQLAGILNDLAPQRVFIVSGKRSYELSGAKQKLEGLLEGIDFRRYSDFEENPKFEDLVKGAAVVRDYHPDLIIAIGGGSVMDTAKIISVLPDDSSRAKAVIKGEAEAAGIIAPLAAIPTTAGSGSEATRFAVAYLDKEKYSVASDLLLPDYVILDPELTYSMPPYQTAVSGMDALCQGIESYWARGANDQSRMVASTAIGILLNSLETAVNHPNPKARLEMAKGANLAGKAINISKTTASHAMSYAFTTYYGIPHGHAVALTLGEFMVFNALQASARSDGELTERMEKLFELLGCRDADSCRDRFRRMMKNIGLETKLSEIIPYDIDIHQLVNSVNIERLGNHPIHMTKEDIHSIITDIL